MIRGPGDGSCIHFPTGPRLLSAPAGEERRHLRLQEFEERERLRQPSSCVGRWPDCFDSGPGCGYPRVQYLLASRDHLIPAVISEDVVVATRAWFAFPVHDAQTAQVTDGARHRRAADLQLLDQLSGRQPGAVRSQERCEHERRHAGHAGIDKRTGEPFDEPPNRARVAPG